MPSSIKQLVIGIAVAIGIAGVSVSAIGSAVKGAAAGGPQIISRG